MPVGTCGTVKGLTTSQLNSIDTQVLLGNTYHLALRPSAEVVAELGGLHRFMGWEKPILTDSGGFQLFSLAQLTRVDDQGAVFRSHIDGATWQLTPEGSVAIQEQLGSDIAMVLDHVIELPASRGDVEDALHRTTRWAERCKVVHCRQDQIQFGIVQGGLDAGLRRLSAEQLTPLDFAGYAIGGLSVGELPEQMYSTIDATIPWMPVDKPRYLMGVGRPIDLLEAIRRGVDMFDCVMPTRNGRNATAFTDQGTLKLRNAMYRTDPRPLQPGFDYPEAGLSRAYIRHLFMSGEMLGPILLSLHNLAYYNRLMRQAREAIEADCFLDLYDRFRSSGFQSRVS